jgi:hypothetical protein
LDFRRLRHTWRRKLGAEEDKQSNHVYYYITIDNREHRIGKVSHSNRGSDKVDDFIISDTCKRMKIDKSELSAVVNCTIDKSQYLNLWQIRT